MTEKENDVTTAEFFSKILNDRSNLLANLFSQSLGGGDYCTNSSFYDHF